jgi:uncharacterized protein
MKRILVLSDTHGDLAGARRAIGESVPLDGLVHLGDLSYDADQLREETGLTLWSVTGNNDRNGPAEDTVVFSLEKVRLFACHGHRFDLHPHHPRKEWKKSFAAMLREAARRQADCVLFGHTHAPYCRRREGMLVMNPGSLWEGEPELSYGLLEIRDGRVTGNIRRLRRTRRTPLGA